MQVIAVHDMNQNLDVGQLDRYQ